jgi:hypothetical protein
MSVNDKWEEDDEAGIITVVAAYGLLLKGLPVGPLP